MAIVFLAVSLAASNLTVFADFADHQDAKNAAQATRVLLEKISDLKPNGSFISLCEKDTDTILCAGKTENGILVSLNVSHFCVQGHGDTANEHEYLAEFPVLPPDASSLVRQFSLPLNKVTPLLNRQFIKFKMVTHGMRRKDTRMLSWASSRLLIYFKDIATTEKVLPALVKTIFEERKHAEFIIIPSKRENQP
jgi:hypothetical protein